MKSKSYNSSKTHEPETQNLWEAFVNHIDSIYFPGASELLDTQTIAFEYEQFKQCYA